MTATAPSSVQVEPDLPASPEEVAEAFAGALLWMVPGTVELATNRRTGLGLDTEQGKALAASIAARGVRTPVGVTITPDGRARLRFGFKRRACAERAGRLLPCFVLARELDATPDQLAELLDQWDENEARSGFTTRDRALAIQEALDLGLDEKTAARSLGVPRADVRRAAAIVKSAAAQSAVVNHSLTLEQGQVYAEFDGDEAAQAALVEDLAQFDHVAQRLRDQRAFTAKRGKLIDRLRKAGIDVPDTHPGHQDTGWLYTLRDVDEDDHQKNCPGRAAWVPLSPGRAGSDEPSMMAYCADPRKYGHSSMYSTARPKGPMSDSEKAERKAKGDGNRAWRSARTVRRGWLTEWLTRGSVTPNVLVWVIAESVTSIHGHRRELERKHPIARKLLKIDAEEGGYYDPPLVALAVRKATSKRAQVILAATVFGGYEDHLTDDTWERPTAAAAHYLGFLQELGYTLAECEQAVVDKVAADNVERLAKEKTET